MATNRTLTLKQSPDIELQRLREIIRVCADELDEAVALRIGVMDSESRAHAVNAQRMGAMQSVAGRLREAALA
jgi:hypothetical protein